MNIAISRILTAVSLLTANAAFASEKVAWAQLSAGRELAPVAAVEGRPVGLKADFKPQPSTVVCVMGMEYQETTYSLLPLIGGLSWKRLAGNATVICPERSPIQLSMRGEGQSIGITIPNGDNPFVHNGSRVSGSINIRVPSLITEKEFEGTYVNAGVSTPIGGVELSPWLNTSLDFALAIYIPSHLEGAVGVGLKTLTLRLR